MTKQEFQTKRTEILSRMLDNPDECGIYPTTQCFQELDELFYSVQADQPDKPEWSEINAELKRAEQKHPNFPTDMFRQLAIMQEEAGEVTKAVLHYHYEKGTLDDVREELIQTAAMCLRMLKNLPATPQKQQKQ